MKKRNTGKKSKRHMLFDPDEISTSISQAIVRDMAAPLHVYGDANDPVAYAKSRQATEILKKYSSQDAEKEKLELEAFEKFIEINKHMLAVNRGLEQTIPWEATCIRASTPFMDRIHIRARALMHEVLRPFTEDELHLECRNSSGSTVGVPYTDTSIEKKFTFPMSVTKDCLPYLERYWQTNKQLACAVSNWNSKYPLKGKPYRLVRGSLATTVDKTSSKRRMISKEPTGNMYLQQGLMQLFYERMRAFGLNVELLPDENRYKAWMSSITGSDATIDWSEASNCVSTVLVRWLLPSLWYEVCDMTRSRYTTVGGRSVKLGMFSTMGNAVTFPLETLVFWTYAHATHHTLTEPGSISMFKRFEHRPGSISVFGDDCIVPDAIASKYIEVMESVGFIVNSEKSCLGSMQFRESCGGDYLAGFNVRPFNLKAPPRNRLSNLEPWLYIIWNRCLEKYISYFGTLSYVYDKELWKTLIDLFTRYNLSIKVVPSFLPDDAGLKLEDLARFRRHYSMNFDTIEVSRHGTVKYRYCRFVYWQQCKRSDDIRMIEWLMRPYQSQRVPIGVLDDVYTNRKKGGYVVATGITCHWQVPCG